MTIEEIALATVIGEQRYTPEQRDVDEIEYEVGHSKNAPGSVSVTITGGQHIFYPFTQGDIDVSMVYIDCGEYVIEFEPTATNFETVINTIEKTTATAELSAWNYDIAML
jgi:hypothetical protein